MNIATPIAVSEIREEDRSHPSRETPSTTTPHNTNIEVDRARQLRTLDRLDEADALLDGILNAEPETIAALVERGHIRRRRGNHEEAVTAFKAAAALDPANHHIQIEMARSLRATNRLDEAIKVVGRVLDVDPRQVPALIELGLISRRKLKHNDAVSAFRAAATIDPQNRNTQVELARDLRALGQLDEAYSVLSNILDAEPSHAAALIERGLICRLRGDHGLAVAAFRSAVAADPKNRNIQVELARDLRAHGELDEADAILGSVLNAEPNRPGALVERGHLRRARGDHAAALDAFELAARIDPNSFGIQLEIANSLSALGRPSDAEAVLRKLVDAAPNNVSAIVRLAHQLMDVGQLDQADAILYRALRTHFNDSRIFAAFAHLARRRGDSVSALQNFRSAMETDPTNINLKLDYAAELREQGYFEEALSLLQSVVRAESGHWAAWMQLGLYYRAKGDSRSAIEAFSTAVAKQPRRTQGLVDLALEQWAVGNLAEAKRHLNEALEQDPTHLVALAASAENALQSEQPAKAAELAERALQSHPGQLIPYLIAARAAAGNLELKRALDFIDRANKVFGSHPDIAAARIHILRQYREHNSISALLANTDERADTSFSFWAESTSFQIAVGLFDAAEQALNSAPARSIKEAARVHALRASLAEGRRQYSQAIASYREALTLDPRSGGWHAEMARAHLLTADFDAVREDLQAALKIDASRLLAAGQSLNISQHHTGQLLDDFTVDRELVAKLKSACAVTGVEKLAALEKLVQDDPEKTAPAVQLVLAMRQLGLFSYDGAQSSVAPRIPRRIIQFWDSEVPPPDIRELIASWTTSHGDYEHRLYNEFSADQYLRARFPEDVCDAFDRAGHPAQKADIFRLAYLASDGGFYIDADDRCLARLNTFVPASAEMVCYQENYATIANNFLGAVPHHPVIVRALKLAVEAVNRGDRDVVWLSTGPGLLTRAFAQVAAETPSHDWLKSARVLELWEAQRALGIHCPAAYKNTDQHWSRAASRRQPK